MYGRGDEAQNYPKDSIGYQAASGQVNTGYLTKTLRNVSKRWKEYFSHGRPTRGSLVAGLNRKESLERQLHKLLESDIRGWPAEDRVDHELALRDVRNQLEEASTVYQLSLETIWMDDQEYRSWCYDHNIELNEPTEFAKTGVMQDQAAHEHLKERSAEKEAAKLTPRLISDEEYKFILELRARRSTGE
jgi:hypothetical protein